MRRACRAAGVLPAPLRYRNHAGEWKTDPRQTGSEVSEWLYNFGPDRLMLQLRFLDGQLQDVKTLGYGH
ncbi:DUF2845 domain-containing protein [Chitinibacter sp. FCG-7]|uniref:DUF2845 domain-containing protein n=1 Tax=Chitinibacter mangrovi TaxID=3153927 RepID=A0AAU7FD43_9NEIS